MTEEQRSRLIKAFVEVRRCLQQTASQGELTQGEFLVLRRIKYEREGSFDKLKEFKAVRISEFLSMPPPAVSRIFNALEGRGLIKRSINQDNRRSVIISLTEKGEVTLKNAEAKVNAFFDKLTTKLGEEDLVKLLTLLESVIDFFEAEQFSGGEGDG